MVLPGVDNPRIYGKAPFSVAVIHGGPGAPGHMAPVARELSTHMGILEPLQTADSIEGQVQELKAILQEFCSAPVALIGSSWGAMLSYLLAAKYPSVVEKLILVGSAVYEEKYANDILETRLGRLSSEEVAEVHSLVAEFMEPNDGSRDDTLARLGKLFTKADAYCPFTLDTEDLGIQYHIYQQVWTEAVKLRQSGELLELGRRVRCPVLAIHGDYDPNPPEGVQRPLSLVIRDFRFVLLKECGHLPWIERKANGPFFEVLREELGLARLR